MTSGLGSFYPRGLMAKAEVARDILRTIGWRSFFGRVLPWLVCRRYAFYSESLDHVREAPERTSPFRLDLARPGDIPVLAGLRPRVYRISLLEERLGTGHLCFIGRYGSRPIHIRWMFVRSLYIPYLHRTLLLSPGEVYGDEAYTIPEFRRTDIYRRAGLELRPKLKESGYRRYTYAYASWHPLARAADGHGQPDKAGDVIIKNYFGFRTYAWSGSLQDHGDGTVSINPH